MTSRYTTIFAFIIIISLFWRCSDSNQSFESDYSTSSVDQKNEAPICINHSLLILDSITYQAAVNSEFLKQFAFSQVKHLSGYHGFYLIGKTNYIELFHPKSIDDEINNAGDSWICLASLKPNHIDKLNLEAESFISMESNSAFQQLSLSTKDSLTPITVLEMKKEQYESWTKKRFNDTVTFLPVDYNSPQEADSSQNYYMKDVNGIGLCVNSSDTSDIRKYFNSIGFSASSNNEGKIRFSNNSQFIELHISNQQESPTINRYYIQLNKPMGKKTEVIGNSRIEYEGSSAIWYFD